LSHPIRRCTDAARSQSACRQRCETRRCQRASSASLASADQRRRGIRYPGRRTRPSVKGGTPLGPQIGLQLELADKGVSPAGRGQHEDRKTRWPWCVDLDSGSRSRTGALRPAANQTTGFEFEFRTASDNARAYDAPRGRRSSGRMSDGMIQSLDRHRAKPPHAATSSARTGRATGVLIRSSLPDRPGSRRTRALTPHDVRRCAWHRAQDG